MPEPVAPLDGSPVKTQLTTPDTAWTPQTVAEHNASVDEKSDALAEEESPE